METKSPPNCSGLTDEQLKELALPRGIASVVGFVILLLMLMLLLILTKCRYQRVCGTIIKRLTIGLTTASMLCILTYALQLKNYFDSQNDTVFCEVDGFLVMYTSSVQLLFTIGFSVVLFVKVWQATTSWKPLDDFYTKVKAKTLTCCGCKVNKLEIVLYASMIVLPLLIDWIPFITGSYGPAVAWCWIRRYVSNDCSSDQAGFWEGIWIWDVPFGFVAILILGLFVTSVCLLRYGIKNTPVHKLVQVGVFDYLFLLAFLALLFFLFALHMIVIIYYFSFKRHSFALWVVDSISYPITITFIPLALLTIIYLPFSVLIAHTCCKWHRQINIDQEHDHATVHRSSQWMQQPSHTTWSPPHSSVKDSENIPFGRDQQQQNYGSNA